MLPERLSVMCRNRAQELLSELTPSVVDVCTDGMMHLYGEVTFNALHEQGAASVTAMPSDRMRRLAGAWMWISFLVLSSTKDSRGDLGGLSRAFVSES